MLPLPPGYNLIRVIHEGALASVYLVEAASSGGGRFALNVLDLDEVAGRLGDDAAAAHGERFRAAYEAQTELAESAPGVWAGVRSIGQRDGQAFVLLEYLPTSAAVLIQRKALVSHGVLAAVGVALAEGLAAAWARGGGCGCVKAGNVLVDEGSRVRAPAARLSDFEPGVGAAARGAELRSAAGILHELITHRALSEMLTGVEPGPDWARLGPKAGFWAGVCNTLLDESAPAEERLARVTPGLVEAHRGARSRARGARVRQTALIGVGAGVVFGAVGGGGVWAVSRLGASRGGAVPTAQALPAGVAAWETEARWLTPLVAAFARDEAWTLDPRVGELRGVLEPAVRGEVVWRPGMGDGAVRDDASLAPPRVPAGTSEAEVEAGLAYAARVRATISNLAFFAQTRAVLERWRARGWAEAADLPGTRAAAVTGNPEKDPWETLPRALADHERVVSAEAAWSDVAALGAGEGVSPGARALAGSLRRAMGDALAGQEAGAIGRWLGRMPMVWRTACVALSESWEPTVLGTHAACALVAGEPDGWIAAGVYAAGVGDGALAAAVVGHDPSRAGRTSGPCGT